MTDIDRYICEQIARAEYLDEETKTSWIARIHADGLNPATTRLLLQTMLDRALAKIGDQLDPARPDFKTRYDGIMAEIDRAEADFQTRLGLGNK